MLLDWRHHDGDGERICATTDGGATSDIRTRSTRRKGSLTPRGFVMPDSGHARRSDDESEDFVQPAFQHFCMATTIGLFLFLPCQSTSSMRPSTLLRTSLLRQAITPLRNSIPASPRIPRPAATSSIRHIRHSAVRLDATPPKAKQCPSCGSHLSPAASPCPSCKSLVPIPSDVSYYALFDLVPPGSSVQHELTQMEGGGYVLDGRDLRTRYLKRQQGCHPDSYTGQGKVRRRSPIPSWKTTLISFFNRCTISHSNNPLS